MPELPEVETVKLQLQKYLVGHIVENTEIKRPNIFTGNVKDVIGAKVKSVRRFAKVLSIDLSNGNSMVIHIKLTGQIIYRGPNLKDIPVLSKKIAGGVPGPHTHIIFTLDNPATKAPADAKLYYNDIRRFGWIKVIKTSEVETSGFVGKLGPEPFGVPQGKPPALTLDYFKSVLLKTKRPIKVVIMDQAKMGGVGNIYATDALWLAKINPKKPSQSLSIGEIKALYDAIHAVLTEGLKYGGASELAFVTPDGAEGEYQNHTLAYGHQGEICKSCKKTKIDKYFLAGRGTYWCPFCQK